MKRLIAALGAATLLAACKQETDGNGHVINVPAGATNWAMLGFSLTIIGGLAWSIWYAVKNDWFSKENDPNDEGKGMACAAAVVIAVFTWVAIYNFARMMGAN